MPVLTPQHTTDAKAVDPDSLGFLIVDMSRLMRGTFEREIEKVRVPVTASEAQSCPLKPR